MTDSSDVCRELKMADFSNAEMTDMVLMYGQALGNLLGAQRLYHETFPERRLPNHKTFAAVKQRLRENGKFQLCCNDRGRERTERVLDTEKKSLNTVEEN